MRYGRLVALSLVLLLGLAVFTSASPLYAATGGGQHRQRHLQRQHHPQQLRRHAVVFFEGRYQGAIVQHPGSRLSILWIAGRGLVNGRPRSGPILLGATLVGPYASLASLKQAQRRPVKRAPVAAKVIRLNARSYRTVTSALIVPRKARPGYYRLILRAITPTQRHDITFVITIKPS